MAINPLSLIGFFQKEPSWLDTMSLLDKARDQNAQDDIRESQKRVKEIFEPDENGNVKSYDDAIGDVEKVLGQTGQLGPLMQVWEKDPNSAYNKSRAEDEKNKLQRKAIEDVYKQADNNPEIARRLRDVSGLGGMIDDESLQTIWEVGQRDKRSRGGEDKPSYDIMFDKGGNAVVVNKKNLSELQNAISSGHPYTSPPDTFLEDLKNSLGGAKPKGADISANEEAARPAPAPTPVPTPAAVQAFIEGITGAKSQPPPPLPGESRGAYKARIRKGS